VRTSFGRRSQCETGRLRAPLVSRHPSAHLIGAMLAEGLFEYRGHYALATPPWPNFNGRAEGAGRTPAPICCAAKPCRPLRRGAGA